MSALNEITESGWGAQSGGAYGAAGRLEQMVVGLGGTGRKAGSEGVGTRIADAEEIMEGGWQMPRRQRAGGGVELKEQLRCVLVTSMRTGYFRTSTSLPLRGSSSRNRLLKPPGWLRASAACGEAILSQCALPPTRCSSNCAGKSG